MICSICKRVDIPNMGAECESVTCGKCALYLSLLYADKLALEYPPERSRLLRKKLKWSQEVLALKCCINISRISQFEGGKIDCPPELVKLLDEMEET